MGAKHILVVEDERKLAQVVESALQAEHYATGPAQKLATGFKAAVNELGKAKSGSGTKQ